MVTIDLLGTTSSLHGFKGTIVRHPDVEQCVDTIVYSGHGQPGKPGKTCYKIHRATFTTQGGYTMPLVSSRHDGGIVSINERLFAQRGHYFSGSQANIFQAASDWLFEEKFDAMETNAMNYEKYEIKQAARAAEVTYEITIGTGGFGVETVSYTKDEFRNKITELEDSLETWNESYRRSPSTGGRRGIDLNEIRMASLLAEWERHFGNGQGSSAEDMVRSQMSFSGATTDVSITTGGVKYDIPRSEIMTQTEMVRQGNEELGISDDVFIEGLGGSVADVETAGTEIIIDEETTLEDKQDDTDDWISRNLMPKARTIAIIAGAAGFAYLLSRKRSKRR